MSTGSRKNKNEVFKHGVYISQSSSKCSIILVDVFKKHNNETVFNGLNFIAHSGKIYRYAKAERGYYPPLNKCAVLGEAKSGKSTLLSCLVGGSNVDNGHIWVLGGKPRTKSSRTLTKCIGYMPQELSLYKTMTFLELLAYFGQLYDVNFKFILWRISYYSDIFTLPPTNVIIKNLSFSEKRMVSFIIAVFHRPRLVVLDEPTVGLDILKKIEIWNYLNHAVETWKPTVIVATNSIEEAFLATKIAYLKNGKIVFEKEVEKLLRENPNKSIDLIIKDLYTSLITNNSDENKKINSNSTEIPHNKKLSIYKKIKPRSNIWKLHAVTLQNMKAFTRNVWIFNLLCVIPTLQVLLHCTHYGEYPDPFPVAVYNQEIDCIYNPCEHIENCTYFSCHFLNFFAMNNIKIKYYDTVTLAKDSVTKGLTLGLMNVPKNYTKSIIKSLIQSSPTEYDSLSKFKICIELDMTNFEFGKHLRENLLNAHKLHLTGIYTQYNLSKSYAEVPYKIYEYRNLGLTENTASEIISCAIFSSAMFYSALLLQSEIKNGYLTRNLIAGVTIIEIVLSILIIQTIFSTVQAFCFFLMVDFLLHISWQSSLLLIILLNIAISICGMSIGLYIGSFVNSSNKVFHVTLAVYFVNIIMSDLFWPQNNVISIITPLSLPTRAVKAVLIQGRQIKPQEIIGAVIVLTFWTMLSFIAFVLKLKKKINFNVL